MFQAYLRGIGKRNAIFTPPSRLPSPAADQHDHMLYGSGGKFSTDHQPASRHPSRRCRVVEEQLYNCFSMTCKVGKTSLQLNENCTEEESFIESLFNMRIFKVPAILCVMITVRILLPQGQMFAPEPTKDNGSPLWTASKRLQGTVARFLSCFTC